MGICSYPIRNSLLSFQAVSNQKPFFVSCGIGGYDDEGPVIDEAGGHSLDVILSLLEDQLDEVTMRYMELSSEYELDYNIEDSLALLKPNELICYLCGDEAILDKTLKKLNVSHDVSQLIN